MMAFVLRSRELLLAAAIVALLSLIASRFPGFVAPGNLANVFNDTAILIILALAQMTVILTFATGVGALFMKTQVATILGRFGFRRVLLINAVVSSRFVRARGRAHSDSRC